MDVSRHSIRNTVWAISNPDGEKKGEEAVADLCGSLFCCIPDDIMCRISQRVASCFRDGLIQCVYRPRQISYNRFDICTENLYVSGNRRGRFVSIWKKLTDHFIPGFIMERSFWRQRESANLRRMRGFFFLILQILTEHFIHFIPGNPWISRMHISIMTSC